jgi:multiple sugar transport system ATP-binding protein
MNLYEARLEPGDEGGVRIALGSQKLSLPASVLQRNPDLGSYQGREVILGIRPEHLSDPAHSGAAPEPGTALAADVDYVEVLGSEQLVHFTIDARKVREETVPAGTDQGEIVSASVAEGVARVDPRSAIRARGRAIFGVDTERLHFFDPATGAAIAPAGALAPAG